MLSGGSTRGLRAWGGAGGLGNTSLLRPLLPTGPSMALFIFSLIPRNPQKDPPHTSGLCPSSSPHGTSERGGLARSGVGLGAHLPLTFRFKHLLRQRSGLRVRARKANGPWPARRSSPPPPRGQQRFPPIAGRGPGPRGLGCGEGPPPSGLAGRGGSSSLPGRRTEGAGACPLPARRPPAGHGRPKKARGTCRRGLAVTAVSGMPVCAARRAWAAEQTGRCPGGSRAPRAPTGTHVGPGPGLPAVM